MPNSITFNYPNSYEQKVISKKTSLIGFDEPPVMGLMTSSFYEERPNQVISPLSSLALRHYNFQYDGFITVGNFDVFKIKVTPKRKSDELVSGDIYIVDKLWCIYNIDFKSSFEFFDYQIKQQFENLGNNNWLPVSHIINGEISMLGLKGLFYYGTSMKYNTVEDNSPNNRIEVEVEDSITEAPKPKSEEEIQLQKEVNQIINKEELSDADVKKAARLNRKILKEQYQDSTIVAPNQSDYHIEEIKDSLTNNNEFWDTIRAIPLSPAEIRSYQLTDSLMAMGKVEVDSVTGQKKLKEPSLFKKIIGGDHDLLKDSLIKLDYDGLVSPENFDFNTVDGYKYRQRFELRVNTDSGKYYSVTPEISYAFNRKVVLGSLTGKFNNILWDKNLLIISGGKDSHDFKGGKLGIKPIINAASSSFFAKNYMKLYETSFFIIALFNEIKKDLAISGALTYNHFDPLKNNTNYLFSSKKEFSPNIPFGYTETSRELLEQKSFEYLLGINYRKRQHKPWLEKSPFLFMNDFYTVNLQFKQGLKNVFSSVSDFSQIDFTFHQQANISPSAGIDWQINAGHFFNANQMHFSQFKHFSTAEIPVLFNSFAQTFQLLNDYEPSTNESYLNVGTEFRTEYILFRYLSFINQKTWSESLHFNYLTTPALKNYWEAGYSLNSLFFVGNIGVFTGFKGSKFESVMLKISISGFD